MGRYVSLAIAPTINYGIRDVKPGFGTGSFRFFGVSGTFTVPAGISEVRITALGGGGCGQTNTFSGCCPNVVGAGGGGGGYVVATATVTAGPAGAGTFTKLLLIVSLTFASSLIFVSPQGRTVEQPAKATIANVIKDILIAFICSP